MADPRRRSPRPGGRPPKPRPAADPPRRAAFDVLKAVRVDGAYPNLVLPDVLRAHGLTGRDAAFVTELVSGTLRRRGTYEAVLAACVDRPLAKVEARVLDALLLGTHQLLSMRVPAHAAISTTVDLVRATTGPGSGRASPTPCCGGSPSTSCPAGCAGWPRIPAATRTASRPSPTRTRAGWWTPWRPRWARTSWRPCWSPTTRRPGWSWWRAPGARTAPSSPANPTPYSPYGVVLDSGDPGSVAAVSEGRAGVQDEGSQLVAIALAAAAVAQRAGGPRRAVAGHVCRAGRQGRAAGGARGPTGRHPAGEREAAAPLRLVARSLRRAAGVAGVVTADGTRPPWAPGTFDRVLVDVPCTGLGALRRRPEARWRRTPADLEALVPLQRALLASALDSVRPGGVVLYATCSPVLEETAGVVSAVLAARSDATLEDMTALLPGVEDHAGPLTGTVQLWPHRHQTDAMFMALLRRTG